MTDTTGGIIPEGSITVETRDPRTTKLSEFFGPGGTHQLDGWSLNIETIPEPGTSLLLALSLTSLVARRRRGAMNCPLPQLDDDDSECLRF